MSKLEERTEIILNQPQLFNFEIVIDRIRITKGEHTNYIPVDQNDPALAKIPRQGSVRKKRKSVRKNKSRKSKKGKKNKTGTKLKNKRGSKNGSRKSGRRSKSKSSTKVVKPSSSGKLDVGGKSKEENVLQQKSPGSSKKESTGSSKKGSPKSSPKRKSKKGSPRSKGKSESKRKSKRKSQKGSSTATKKRKAKNKQKTEQLPGNRKEIPPFRLHINALGFQNIYITQIDVDPIEEEGLVSVDGYTVYTPLPDVSPLESSDHGPVDPQKLVEALEEAALDNIEKEIGRNEKSKTGSKKGKSRSKSRSSSERESKKPSPRGSKKTSKQGSKKGSKKSSKKGSKKGSKSGSPKKKGKSPKSKKGTRSASGKSTPKTSLNDQLGSPDTWSIASETTIKRGTAITLAETLGKMISNFQGNSIKIQIERYGGQHHKNGETTPVGTAIIPFPLDWSQAILEVQRKTNSRNYDESAFPVVRGLIGRYAIKDITGEDIGDIKLEMNLLCFADAAVSDLFPSDSSLYDALQNSDSIPQCCVSMNNETQRRVSQSGYYDVYHKAMSVNYTEKFGF